MYTKSYSASKIPSKWNTLSFQIKDCKSSGILNKLLWEIYYCTLLLAIVYFVFTVGLHLKVQSHLISGKNSKLTERWCSPCTCKISIYSCKSSNEKYGSENSQHYYKKVICYLCLMNISRILLMRRFF